MRSKAPLTLMEQVLMILVFALAAALCVQVFVFSDRSSRRNELRDRAVLEAQNAAETLKAVGSSGEAESVLDGAAELLQGSVEQGVLCLEYDGDWNVCADGAEVRYRLCARELPTETGGLGMAELRVMPADGTEEYICLTVAWQEVAHG